MRQLSVRGVDEVLGARLEGEARRRGLSLNRTVLALLREATGLKTARGDREFTDLDHLAGTWTEEQYRSFGERLAEQRVIDPEMWS